MGLGFRAQGKTCTPERETDSGGGGGGGGGVVAAIKATLLSHGSGFRVSGFSFARAQKPQKPAHKPYYEPFKTL